MSNNNNNNNNNKRKRKDRQILRSCQRTKEAAEYEVDGDANYSRSAWNGP